MLDELIKQAIALKTGNKEFALFFDGEGVWDAEIGNPSSVVGLGEATAEHSCEGKTAEESVRNLIAELGGEREPSMRDWGGGV